MGPSSSASRLALLVVTLLLGAAPAQAQSVTLAWDPSTDTEVVGYTMHVGISPWVYGQTFDVPGRDTTMFTYTQAVPGTRYYFAVSAYTAENLSSPLSNAVSWKINVGPALVQPANQNSLAGSAVSLQLSATDDGDPLTYSASGLPPGVSIGTSTGRITGTPTVVGRYNITASVSDGLLSAARTFSWAVGAVSAESVAPSTGSSFGGLFVLRYSNALGVTDLTSAEVAFSTSGTSLANTCRVTYDRSAGKISLLNDSGTSSQTGSLGSGTLQNGQCMVALGSSSTSVAGNTLTLNLSMSFRPAYAGAKNVYLYASSAGGNTGWIDKGDWTVPGLPAPLSLPTAAHVEDVNGDGRADVLIQGQDNTFWLSLRTATGFSTLASALRHGGGYNPEGAHRADFDGDGRADVLMQGFDNTFWLSRSTGTGFSSPARVLQHGGAFNPDGAHIADVNGDGRADVLMQGFDNSFWLSLSNGVGFTPPAHVLQHGGAFNPAGAHIADVNGDGRADVLMQGFDNSFWLSLSTGSGFTSPARVLKHGGGFNPAGAHIADVDGDGRADVLMQGFDNTFWLSRSTGTGFTPPARVLQHGGGFNPAGAHIADVDGDGRADVLMQGFDNGFWLSLSTGTGFTSPARVM